MRIFDHAVVREVRVSACKKLPASACFSPKRKQSFITGITNALDFSEARSKRDAELLYQARYQKRKLNEEQIG